MCLGAESDQWCVSKEPEGQPWQHTGLLWEQSRSPVGLLPGDCPPTWHQVWRCGEEHSSPTPTLQALEAKPHGGAELERSPLDECGAYPQHRCESTF